MSEYGDTGNKLLDGHRRTSAADSLPTSLELHRRCGLQRYVPGQRQHVDHYSAITKQLAAMSSSKYYDLGGDEAHPFTAQQYAEFINKESGVVTLTARHQWVGPTGSPPPAAHATRRVGSRVLVPGAADGAAAVQKGMQVVMAPADHAYLDQSYPHDSASGLGLGWACRGCDLDVNYDWDPGSFPGIPDSSVLGVEGALFGETIPTLADAEYLLLRG